MKLTAAHFAQFSDTIKKLWQTGLQRAKNWIVAVIASLRQKPLQWCGLILAAYALMTYTNLLLCKNDYSSLTTLFAALLTLYVAAYAIAWAKYEFHVSRQSQQMSVLAALCATDKRKSFAPALSEMTRKKLPKHPTLFTPRLIWASLCSLPGDKDYLTEDNRDTIDMVVKILRGFNDWQGANLEYINLKDAPLSEIHLEGAFMYKAILEDSRLNGAHLNKTDLTEANLKNAGMWYCKMPEVILDGAMLNNAKMQHANLEEAILGGKTDFSGAKLQRACFNGCNLSDVILHGADVKDAILEHIVVEKTTEMKLFEALSTAENICSAKLSPCVRKRLQKKYPHLFECRTDNDSVAPSIPARGLIASTSYPSMQQKIRKPF